MTDIRSQPAESDEFVLYLAAKHRVDPTGKTIGEVVDYCFEVAKEGFDTRRVCLADGSVVTEKSNG